MVAEVVQQETGGTQQSPCPAKPSVAEPTVADPLDLVKDADEVVAAKKTNATPVVSESTSSKPTEKAVKKPGGGMTSKLVELFKANPQCAKLLVQGEEAWEKLSPKLEPVIKIWDSVKEDYPDLMNYVFAVVLICYGGCFTNLTVLFAALSLAGTMDVATSVFEKASTISADDGILNGFFAFLRSTSPEEVNKMVAAICVQICVLKLMCGWMPSFALTLGFACGSFVFEAFKSELVALIKQQGIVPEDLVKWVPFGAKHTIGLLCAIMAAIAPSFTATVLAGFYGVAQVKDSGKTLEGAIGVGVPVVFALWQCYSEYQVCTLTYLLLSPLFLLNSML